MNVSWIGSPSPTNYPWLQQLVSFIYYLFSSSFLWFRRNLFLLLCINLFLSFAYQLKGHLQLLTQWLAYLKQLTCIYIPTYQLAYLKQLTCIYIPTYQLAYLKQLTCIYLPTYQREKASIKRWGYCTKNNNKHISPTY
jgi:hypothetical protein